MSESLFQPLPREEVVKAVEGKKPCRIPLVQAKWIGEGLEDQYGERLRELDRYPEDSAYLWCAGPVAPERMGLSWAWEGAGGHDSSCVIDDWAKLDEFLEKLLEPESDPQFAACVEKAEAAHATGMYVMFGWWRLFFEKPWGLRGMQNLMCDYYLEKENIHRLHDGICAAYEKYIHAAGRAIHPDGFWTSDDLGHQTGPMMSPEVFHELIYPYYCRVGAACRQEKMHFWLHSCGDNTLLLPDLIDAGVTVFHPVQKYTMDEKEVAEKFGGRITFLAGIDVQHTLQEKDPEGVREEVRFLIDTFDRPEGRLCLAAGNGIVSGTPFENIEAFLDEAIRYGAAHRARQ